MNRERTQVRVWQVDGTEITMLANPDDDRFRLLVDGDPLRGVAPIEIRDMSLEELRVQALIAVGRWEQVSLGRPITVAGRAYAANKFDRERLEAMALSAETARKMNQPFSKRYPTNDGELVVMERDDVLAVWQALVTRNFGDARTGKMGVIQIAADLKNRIRQAGSETEIEELINTL